MKVSKIIAICSMVLFCFFVQFKEVKAYEFPSTVYYIKLVESNLGEITFYFPSNQVQFLSFEKGDSTFINVSSGSIYGYFNYSGNEYRLTCPTFDKPYYRLTGTGTYNTDLNIVSIIETNIDFIDGDSLMLQNEQTLNNLTLFISLGGCMLLCLILLKR